MVLVVAGGGAGAGGDLMVVHLYHWRWPARPERPVTTAAASSEAAGGITAVGAAAVAGVVLVLRAALAVGGAICLPHRNDTGRRASAIQAAGGWQGTA